MGKTHLLDEVGCRGRARGMAALFGRSVGGAGPYRPIADALVSAAPVALADDPRLVPYRSEQLRAGGYAVQLGFDHRLYPDGLPEGGYPVWGLVDAGPALTRVADGFSDAINEIFGERGRHTRATLGVSALAFGVPTVVEGMVAVPPLT